MLEKLARFYRVHNDAKGVEEAREQEIVAPSISLPDEPSEDSVILNAEPSLAFPDMTDEEIERLEAEQSAGAPVFRIDNEDGLSADGAEWGEAADADIVSGQDLSGEDYGQSSPKEKRGLPAALGARLIGPPRASSGVKSGAFATYANPRLWRSADRPLSYIGEVTKLNREVFTPTRPKQSAREFIGRANGIERIVQAIEEERAHVVLFGHKCVGKTSVLNIVNDSACQAGYLVARVMCTADLTFETFVQAIFEDLSAHLAKAPAGSVLEKQLGVERLADLIDGEISDVPAALRVFSRISGHQVIVLLDDFHRVQDAGIKTKIRELMGALSDKGAWVSLVLAGRGDISTTFDFLEGDAPSGTVIFELGLMSANEIAEIVVKGGSRLGIRFDADVADAIVQLSQGLPVVVQWLGLLTARRALRNYADSVTIDDLVEVSDEVSSKVSQQLSGVLDRLQSTSRNAWAGDLLFLAARTPIREDGVFSTTDMSHESRRAVGRTFSELNLHRVMAQFCNGDDDPILEKIATADGVRYRFSNPMMRAVIMLRNARRLDTTHSGMLGGMTDLGALPSPEAV